MGWYIETKVTTDAANRTTVVDTVIYTEETTREKVERLFRDLPKNSLGKEKSYREFGINFVSSFKDSNSFYKLESYFLKSLSATSWGDLVRLHHLYCDKCTKVLFTSEFGGSQCRFCPMDRLQHKAHLKMGDIMSRKANDHH